jgi:hypothetical protein
VLKTAFSKIYSTYQKFENAREKRREAYVKSQFSPRSQKIGFLTEGVEIFFEGSHNGWLLPEFVPFFSYLRGGQLQFEVKVWKHAVEAY